MNVCLGKIYQLSEELDRFTDCGGETNGGEAVRQRLIS